MIQITNKADCCGCTACASVCALHAISMEPDALGFLYPKVDTEKCTNCGLCEKVCAFNSNYDKSLNLTQPLAYAARHKDMKEVETSRSGAAFIAISDYVLDNGGVVYGAGYTDHFRVIHKRATTKQERDEFKGSKYVQSDLNHVFLQIKKDLKDGLTVLFSGTPCQTAGLNSFIGKKLREHLILVDIVCHGVPSPYIWKDYIAYLEKKYKDSICQVNFRDKQLFGWTAHHETFKFSNIEGKKLVSKSFKYLFYKHVMLRLSCGVCPYTNTRRPSDITIGDFWGWEKTDPNINTDDKGVSLILINTKKGSMIFDSIKSQMITIPAKLEDCLQPNLQHPSAIHPKRMQFEHDYQQKGFSYIMRKYGDIGWKYKVGQIKQNLTQRIKKL